MKLYDRGKSEIVWSVSETDWRLYAWSQSSYQQSVETTQPDFGNRHHQRQHPAQCIADSCPLLREFWVRTGWDCDTKALRYLIDRCTLLKWLDSRRTYSPEMMSPGFVPPQVNVGKYRKVNFGRKETVASIGGKQWKHERSQMYMSPCWFSGRERGGVWGSAGVFI